MTDQASPNSGQHTGASARSAILTALTALIFGLLGAAIWSISGLADTRTRAFLMDNPEMLPEMAEALQQRETSSRLDAHRIGAGLLRQRATVIWKL